MKNLSDQINKLTQSKRPFLFVVDYACKQIIIMENEEFSNSELLFSINGYSNFSDKSNIKQKDIKFIKYPQPIENYNASFNIVKKNLLNGNSYLTNLTCETPIKTNLSLEEIFHLSQAPYKLYLKNKFVVFSPESFIKIINGRIYSYPMKGTIDGSIKNAEKLILENKKEAAEHATIVDLIRNDLSKVATNVKVDNYRYIDKVKTHYGELLQVSSKISGELPANYIEILGNIIVDLLPAGSISGAPKKKTLEIINEAENYKRGFYTGIFGYFDGKNLDSGVMIRFIETKNGKMVFKSGGGITVNSKMEDEYNEMVRKVYLPI